MTVHGMPRRRDGRDGRRLETPGTRALTAQECFLGVLERRLPSAAIDELGTMPDAYPGSRSPGTGSDTVASADGLSLVCRPVRTFDHSKDHLAWLRFPRLVLRTRDLFLAHRRLN